MKNRFFLLLFCFCSACSIGPDLPGLNFNMFKNTPAGKLAQCLQRQDTAEFKALWEKEPINLDLHEPKYGNTLLITAVGNNKEASARVLLELGANPNERCWDDRYTPLITACHDYSQTCNASMVKLLIQYKADVNLPLDLDRIEEDGSHLTSNETPLIFAVSSNCFEIVKTLLDSGANINQYAFYPGYGAITRGLLLDELKIVKYLIIKRGAAIPPVCFIRFKGKKNEQRLSVVDLLNETNYPVSDSNYFYKKEILAYLSKK